MIKRKCKTNATDLIQIEITNIADDDKMFLRHSNNRLRQFGSHAALGLVHRNTRCRQQTLQSGPTRLQWACLHILSLRIQRQENDMLKVGPTLSRW